MFAAFNELNIGPRTKRTCTFGNQYLSINYKLNIKIDIIYNYL